jgi:hypothetical protein
MFTWSVIFDKKNSLSGQVKNFFFNTQSNLNLGKIKLFKTSTLCNIHAFHETQKDLLFPDLANFAKPSSNMCNENLKSHIVTQISGSKY